MLNKKILDKWTAHALNEDEVMHLAYGLSMKEKIPNDGCVKFYTYSQLKGKTYPRRGCAYIVLVLETTNFGHYTCLVNQGNSLVWYDSLAVMPDRELKFNDKETNRRLDQTHPYISDMMRAFPGKLEYNSLQNQRDGSSDNSCGFGVGLFILMRHKMSLNQFNKFLRTMSRKLKLTIPQFTALLTHGILYPNKL
jgi:hypothetical protein